MYHIAPTGHSKLPTMNNIPPHKIVSGERKQWDKTKEDQAYFFHTKIFISTIGCIDLPVARFVLILSHETIPDGMFFHAPNIQKDVNTPDYLK